MSIAFRTRLLTAYANDVLHSRLRRNQCVAKKLALLSKIILMQKGHLSSLFCMFR